MGWGNDLTDSVVLSAFAGGYFQGVGENIQRVWGHVFRGVGKNVYIGLWERMLI